MENVVHHKDFMKMVIAATGPIDGSRPTRAMMRRRVTILLKKMKNAGGIEQAVRPMVFMSGISGLLPECYCKFKDLVTEALIFFLKELPPERLEEKIVDQLRLAPHTNQGIRLGALVKDMPCIQKLGQVICRTPGLDPIFKQALVDLEDNVKTVTYRQIHSTIAEELRRMPPGNRIVPQRRIYAEASVCAVVPAEVILKNIRSPVQAVLKIVKPRVRKNLKGDLALLEKLAVFLDDHRADWGMRDFNFSGTLNQVRSLIENEVDLVSEQAHLAAARRYYRGNRRVVIPKPLPVSTPGMTVMSRMEGKKITDVAGLTARRKRLLAKALATTCILKPIQDLSDISIFHGDPHAGNIAYRFDGDLPRIIFYDWAMMGRLTRRERFLMIFLTFGLLSGGRQAVFYAADLITNGQISRNADLESKVLHFIDKTIAGQAVGLSNIFNTIEFFFEELTYLGIIFPKDLMMYEKAAVTLKGVLADIDPSFDRNDYLVWACMVTFLKDLVYLRIHQVIVEEALVLYRRRVESIIDLQKEIQLLLHRTGSRWIKER
jgi:ubiquinone biosynthesis protein